MSASNSGTANDRKHGGSRSGSGRKKCYSGIKSRVKDWQKYHDRIWLEFRIHSSWIRAKLRSGFSTDSAFAAHLLSLDIRTRRANESKHRTTEATRLQSGPTKPRKRARREHDEGKGPLTSTPIRKPSGTASTELETPVNESTTIDITGLSEDVSVHSVGEHSYMVRPDGSVKVLHDSDLDTSSTSSEDDVSSVSSPFDAIDKLEEALYELHDDLDKEHDESESEEEEILWEEKLEGGDESLVDELDSSKLSDFIVVPPASDNLEPITYTPAGDELGSTLLEVIPDPPVADATKLTQEKKVHRSISTQTSEVQPPKPAVPKHVPQYGPHLKFSRRYEESQYQEELGLIKGTKIICSLDLLLQQLGGRCKYPGCIHQTAMDYSLCGTSAMIRWKCPAGHKGRFCTSGDANDVLSNNLQAAAAILLSGNNFSKVEKFAKFMGLSFISSSTFFRVQKLYCIPVIAEWWQWMRGKLVVEFKDEELVVSGDGQCDSPGFSAKNLCYFLMEVVSGYILEVEVLDKRHVGMKSSTMEKQALKNALERLQRVLNIVELCTDASSTIKKLVADDFKEIFHSLDIWHKAKSIRKCIQKVAAIKGNEKISEWSDSIINHFWYCCSAASECGGDMKPEIVLKNRWIGLLHHVCNQHDWSGGACRHDVLKPDDEHPPWFDRRDKDFLALQKVITEPTLLDSLHYYVRFRHTGALECVNSMSLGYASKRCSYKFKVYKARKQLAAIDWNYHVNRADALDKNAEVRHTRKYNQRTKEWNTRVVKVAKDFDYIPILMAKVFRSRLQDINPIDRHLSLSEDDPERIAPTIAHKPPMSSKELFERHQSRFSKCKVDLFPTKK